MSTTTTETTPGLTDLVRRLNPEQRAEYDVRTLDAFRTQINLREFYARGRELTIEQISRHLSIPSETVADAALKGRIQRDHHAERRAFGRAGSDKPGEVIVRDTHVVGWIESHNISYTIPRDAAMGWATTHEREVAIIRRQVAESILSEQAKAGRVGIIEAVHQRRQDAARKQAQDDQAHERAAWQKYTESLATKSHSAAAVKALDESLTALGRSLDDARQDAAIIADFEWARSKLRAASTQQADGYVDPTRGPRERLFSIVQRGLHLFHRVGGEYRLLHESDAG